MATLPQIEVDLAEPLGWDVIDAVRLHLCWSDENIDDVQYRSDPPRLWISCRDESSLESIGRLARAEVEAILADLRAFPAEVWRDLSDLPPGSPTTDDPFPAAQTRGWVSEELPGVLCYSGPLAQRYRALDEDLRDQFVRRGASEVILPSLLDATGLLHSGYLSGHAHMANFVSRLTEKPHALHEFNRDNAVNAELLDLRMVASTALRPEAVLTPAACQPLYRAWRGQRLTGMRFVTGQSRAYRYESATMRGMRRLREFSMREGIFVGTREAVLDARDMLLEVLAEKLGQYALRARIVAASDPFFADTYSQLRRFQLAFTTKHEAQAELPFDGTALAVASVNYHGDHFGSRWGILAEDGSPVHSCCLGFGLDRWCYAMLAQHGLDLDAWPAPIAGSDAR